MTTITAVEFRKNMGDIFRRVQNGEEIAVTYRNSAPIRLATDKPKRQTGKTGLDLFLESINRASKQVTRDPAAGRSYKEVYYEDMAKKHGLSGR